MNKLTASDAEADDHFGESVAVSGYTAIVGASHNIGIPPPGAAYVFEAPVGDSDGDGIVDTTDNCPAVPNPDQVDTDSQDGGDVCDPCPSDPTDTCDTDRSAAESIPPEGGTITTPDGSTAVTIPPGCVTTDTSASITGSTGTDFELTTNLGDATALFSVNIQPAGLTCDNGEPYTIVLTWPDAAPTDDWVDGTSPAIKEDILRLTKNNDVLFGNTQCHDVAHPPPPPTLTTPSCDHDANTFTFQVSSFSDFSSVAPLDTDSDEVPDDFDGVMDNCPLIPNPLQEDIGDADGVGDACDNCPSTPNAGQENNVHPGTTLGDHCEDPDFDTLFDIDDNCPSTANPGQENDDFTLNGLGATVNGVALPSDGDGDACDDDDDNDSFNGTSVATQTPGAAATGCPGGSVPLWADCVEAYLGTDGDDNCNGAPGTGTDAWPPDVDGSGTISAGDVFAIFPSWLGSTARHDLNADGVVSAGDVFAIFPWWLISCT